MRLLLLSALLLAMQSLSAGAEDGAAPAVKMDGAGVKDPAVTATPESKQIEFPSLDAIGTGQVDGAITAKEAAETAKNPGWGFGLSYGISTDFADDLQPREYQHSVSGSVSRGLGAGFSISGGASMYYSSIGRQIFTDGQGRPFSFSWDLGVDIGKSFELGRFAGGDHTASVSVSNSVPISDSNRYEGVRSIPGGSLGLSSSYWDSRITVSNSISYRYLVQTYRYSPVSGALNARDSVNYSLGTGLTIVKNLEASIGFGVSFNRRLDGSVDYTYNNSQSLSYALGKASVSLSHSNGGFTREGQVKLWYIDQYRRLVSANVSYNF